MKKTDLFNNELGLLLLRLSIGGLMMLHGAHKMIFGFTEIRAMLIQKGLPEFLWIGVLITELLCPVLLILGVLSRISGLGVALVMVIAIYMAHAEEAFSLSEHGGLAIELNLLYFFGGLVVFFTGPGKYAFSLSEKKWLQ